MSVILDALSKSKRDADGSQQSNPETPLSRELAYRRRPSETVRESTVARSNANNGFLFGVIFAVALIGATVFAGIQLLKPESPKNSGVVSPAVIPPAPENNVVIPPVEKQVETEAKEDVVIEAEEPEMQPILVTIDFNDSKVEATDPKIETTQEHNTVIQKQEDLTEEPVQVETKEEIIETKTVTQKTETKKNVIYFGAGKDLEDIGDVKLGGIILNKEKPLAMINGKILTENDNYRGIKVVQIAKEQVVIEFKGEEFTLYY